MKLSMHIKQSNARRNASEQSKICRMPNTNTTVIGRNRSRKDADFKQLANI